MRYWLFRVKISGESMWPVLVPGKMYWASSWLQPKVGRNAVFRDHDKWIVKKIIEIAGDRYMLAGTVSWSENYEITKDKIVACLLTQK